MVMIAPTATSAITIERVASGTVVGTEDVVVIDEVVVSDDVGAISE